MDITLNGGEYQLGRYKARFAKFTVQGWEYQGPWMRLVVTNYRMLLLPDDPRNSVSPLDISDADIVRVWNVCLGTRDGVIVALASGSLLYLFVDWSQGAKLVSDIREMLTPPLKPRIAPRVPGKDYMN